MFCDTAAGTNHQYRINVLAVDGVLASSSGSRFRPPAMIIDTVLMCYGPIEEFSIWKFIKFFLAYL